MTGAPIRSPPCPNVAPVTRLMRALTVVLGVLIALGGGAFILVRANANASTGQSAAATRRAGGGSGASGAPSGGGGAGTAGGTGTAAGDHSTTTLFPALATLTTKLDAALAGTDTCLDVENGDGQVLYQHQPDVPLIPASTQKLIVAEAALSVLGSNYRFTTSVVAPAAPVNGEVAGLWLVGGGDPLLATPGFIASEAGRTRMVGYPWTPLSSLASALAADGVTSVPGGVRGDASYEDGPGFLPVWPASYQQQEQIGVLSALSVDEGAQFTPPHTSMAADPPFNAASQLAQLLSSPKSPVGPAADQTAPAGSVVLASVSSAPLSQIIEAMLRASDDWIAELLVRAIDKEAGGTGTTTGGVAVVMRAAAQAGIPLNGVQMDDGSGLSRTDRATCQELLAALDLGGQSDDAPVLAGLAVAGQTGTLADRYNNTPIAGKLLAKTGSLDGVAGMVGQMTVAAPVHFAFLDNDNLSETALYDKEDSVVEALAAYPGAPGGG